MAIPGKADWLVPVRSGVVRSLCVGASPHCHRSWVGLASVRVFAQGWGRRVAPEAFVLDDTARPEVVVEF